jgi:DeoR family transcriptional regulator, galactitol utilization operon repressor
MAKELGFSSVTIRSDLKNLESEGLLRRAHGGAQTSFHPYITERLNNNLEAKQRIAKAAAAMVKDGDTIMIDAGTTSSMIVKYLVGKRDVNIVTNNLLIMPYARTNPALHVTIVGGEFRPSTESLVGPVALRELQEFHVNLAFVGTDGFSTETGMTTHLVEGAEIVKCIARQSSRTILLTDSSKHGRAGFVKILPMNGVHEMICDHALNPSVVAELKSLGLTVQLV